MGTYHLKNYQIVNKPFDYVTSVRKDFAILIEKLLSTSPSLAPLNEDNDKTAGSIHQGFSDPSLDLENLEMTINPSSFGAFDIARRLVLRHKQSLACWTSPKNSGNGSTAVSPCGEILFPSCGTPQKSIYKLVSAGLHCLVNLLVELNEKDPQVCCTALNSLFNLLHSLPVEDLSAEPKSMVDNLFQILAQLRRSQCEDVSNMASSCLISLAIAYGNTELFVECASNFLTSVWQPQSEHTGVSNVSIPDNYLTLYKHTLNVAFSGYCNSWAKISLNESNTLCKSYIPRMATTTKSTMESSQIFAAVATDGRFLYVLNGDGLSKIGSGFTETKLGHVYAVNAQLKAISDSWMAVCTGSLYLRRKHSTKISVLDNETLTEVGEILLPATVAQGTLCSDGNAFSLMTIDDATNILSIKILNDSFTPIDGEEAKISLAEAKYIAFGDHTSIDINELMTTLDANFVTNIQDLQITKNLATLLTKDGKVYFAGKGILSGMPDNYSKWQELLVQERMSAMSLSQDGQNLVLISRSGHIYAFGERINDDSLPRTKLKNTSGFPKKIQIPNSRKAVFSSCNNGIIGVITENGKFFLLGRQSGLCNPETKQVIGLEHIHISQISMGKTHNVVVTNQGHVYTFGANNLGQCGRADLSIHYRDSDSEKSKTDDESSDVVIAIAPTTSTQAATPVSMRLCAPSAHVWKREMATICTACGFCSSRGHECVFAKNRPKGSLCGCGFGLSGCFKCGICRMCSRQYGASGSEIDTESDGQPFPLTTPSRLIFKAGSDYVITEASCGNYHTILRTVDGLIITFGSNRNGQLGVGDTKNYQGPQIVSLPPGLAACQVAAGANHCIVRCKDGTVYSFGKYHNGQLGRDGRQKFWFAQPGLVDGFASDSKKSASWVGAGGDVTIIRYDHCLFSAKAVSNGCVAANQLQFIIIPRSNKIVKPSFYNITRTSDNLKKLVLNRGNMIPDSVHCYWCLDPLYDTIWCYKADKNELNCFVPFAKCLSDKKSENNFIRNPEFWIPLMKGSTVDDTQLGLNMLMIFYTLLDDKLRGSTLDLPSEQDATETTSKENYNHVSRFQSYGGGWGYSLQSVEAVQFCCSRDVALAGYGLFGGRGEYLAKLKLLKIVNDDGDDRHAETIAETDDIIYECAVREHAPLFFTKPIVVKAGEWHVAWVAVNGPSSDCGSSGLQTITTEDGVTFYFRNSRLSNNGTDVHVGQIPVLLYKLAKFDEVIKPNQDESTFTWGSNLNLSSRFFFRLVPTCFTSLLKVVKLAIETTIFAEFNKKSSHHIWEIERASSCVILCLRILKYFTLILYPSSKQPSIEHKEFIPYIENMFQIIVAIMDAMKIEHANHYASIQFLLNECINVFHECFHVFFPSPSLAAHFLQTLMKNDNRSDWTLHAFISALSSIDSPLSVITSSSAQQTDNLYPMLLTMIRKSRKIPLNTNLDFVTLLQFFMEMAFEPNVNESCNLRLCATDFLLRLSNELVSIKNENGGSQDSPSVLHTPKRFTRLSTAMTWDTSSGSPDAISFQVIDSYAFGLKSFVLYIITIC